MWMDVIEHRRIDYIMGWLIKIVFKWTRSRRDTLCSTKSPISPPSPPKETTTKFRRSRKSAAHSHCTTTTSSTSCSATHPYSDSHTAHSYRRDSSTYSRTEALSCSPSWKSFQWRHSNLIIWSESAKSFVWGTTRATCTCARRSSWCRNLPMYRQS